MSLKPLSHGGEVKMNYDPEQWEPFEREIEVSLMRIYSLEWVEERAWTGRDRLWRVKGKWSREKSVYAEAASGGLGLRAAIRWTRSQRIRTAAGNWSD